jgi:hypothetical protein
MWRMFLAGDWTKPYNEKVHNSYASEDIRKTEIGWTCRANEADEKYFKNFIR